VCPTPTPTPTKTTTPTPTPTKTTTPTPTPTATATCITYTITSGTLGARVSFNGCCRNSGETSLILPASTGFQKCSTTLPVVTNGTATITSGGACPSCDDAIVTINYRTSNGGFTTNQTGTLSYTLNGGSPVTLSTTIASNHGTLYVGVPPNISCNYGDILVFNFVANTGGNNSWGQGNSGPYNNIGCFGNTYTYNVLSTGAISLYFNITSLNTIWGSTC